MGNKSRFEINQTRISGGLEMSKQEMQVKVEKVIDEFVIDTLKDPDTKINPEMVAAIAELIKVKKIN